MARVATTPEKIGLVGCWQVLVIEREELDLCETATPPTLHRRYYVTSYTVAEQAEADLIKLVRSHWSAIENGTHYRRDVTLGEDACRVRHPNAAALLASLRNLVNGAYELERAAERTKVATLKSWCEQQTFTKAAAILKR